MSLEIRPTPPPEVAAAIAAAVQALQTAPAGHADTVATPWRRRALLEGVTGMGVGSEPHSPWRAALMRSV